MTCLGNTPFFEATAGEHTEIADYLKTKGGTLVAKNEGALELSVAVSKGDLEKVKEVIKSGVDVNAPNEEGSTGMFGINLEKKQNANFNLKPYTLLPPLETLS